MRHNYCSLGILVFTIKIHVLIDSVKNHRGRQSGGMFQSSSTS